MTYDEQTAEMRRLDAAEHVWRWPLFERDECGDKERMDGTKRWFSVNPEAAELAEWIHRNDIGLHVRIFDKYIPDVRQILCSASGIIPTVQDNAGQTCALFLNALSGGEYIIQTKRDRAGRIIEWPDVIPKWWRSRSNSERARLYFQEQPE